MTDHDDNLTKALRDFETLADKPLTRQHIADHTSQPDLDDIDTYAIRTVWQATTALIELELLRRHYELHHQPPPVHGLVPIHDEMTDETTASIARELIQLQNTTLAAAANLPKAVGGITTDNLRALLSMMIEQGPTT